eukprot:gene32-9634_t
MDEETTKFKSCENFNTGRKESSADEAEAKQTKKDTIKIIDIDAELPTLQEYAKQDENNVDEHQESSAVFHPGFPRPAWEENGPVTIERRSRDGRKEEPHEGYSKINDNELIMQSQVENSKEKEQIIANGNEEFTICRNCLSNRRNEFAIDDESSKNIDTSSLNSSKEICICSSSWTDVTIRCLDVKDRDPANEPGIFQAQNTISNESSCYNISDLPDEIMLRIFSYFSPTELCRYVAPVCVTWLAYARDSTLWEVITEQEFKDVSSELLVKVILSWCSLLRVLDIKGRTDLKKADFEAIFKSCPLIEVISFAFCSQIDDEIVKLMSTYCCNLMFANFEGCQISDASLMYLIGKPIHGLNLSHCNLISDDGLIFIANNFKNITSINVDGIQWISQNSVEILIREQRNNLTEIQLDGDDLMDEVLSISFCDALTDASLDGIKHFKYLKHLQLKKGLNFSREAMLELIKNLRYLESPGLGFLGLAECSSLSDQCLRAISESCPNLSVLNLSWCWEVTDDGINFIMDSCHEVTELHLCGLHELYGIPFRRVPLEMPKLKFLDLRQCNKISDDLLADLANEMKTLTILNYYGDVVKPSLNFWNLESKCSRGHFHHTSY